MTLSAPERRVDTDDDLEYRRNVRTMALVLAAIVLVTFAAIFVPPYVNPPRQAFPTLVSVNSPYGFVLSLELNSTSVARLGTLGVTAWVNSTSSQIQNLTSASSWPIDEDRLWGTVCTPGWPIGVGFLLGYYTQYNYTEGTLEAPRFNRTDASLGASLDLPTCLSREPPDYILLSPHGSRAFAVSNGTGQVWDLRLEFGFKLPGAWAYNHTMLPRVYTVLVADEWGDVVLTHFRVS